jgi:hypothetical protein
VENHFRFSNVKMRVGVSHDLPLDRDTSSTLGFQLGLGVYAINYRLKQTNNVQKSLRTQDEGWTEWTPTLGLRYRTKEFEILYTYRRTCGPSECVDMGFGGDRVNPVTISAPVSTGGIIAAPSAPLTIDGGTVHAHQISISIPIR